jgi:hypothetical protein
MNIFKTIMNSAYSARRWCTISAHKFLLIASCLFASTAAEAVVCDNGPITAANHEAEFVGVSYDNANDTSTWYYRFVSGKRPAISHITFALPCPDIRILDAGIWSGTYPDAITHLSKAGKPEPGNFPANPAGDPTTGLRGLKFDLPFNEYQSRLY